jgi:SanA protein
LNPRLQRRLRRAAAWGAVLAAVLVLLSNRWVINSTDSQLYKDSALLPDNETALVLGCSPFASSGKPNPQFRGRMQAAADLYRAGRVRKLILSGANPDSRYNEPKKMREALLELGVPSEAMVLDFAGDSTYESVTRAKVVFGLSEFTIVTQKDHAYRALFLARKTGARAVAYQAPIDGVDGPGFRHPPREVFARVAAVVDVFIYRISGP